MHYGNSGPENLEQLKFLQEGLDLNFKNNYNPYFVSAVVFQLLGGIADVTKIGAPRQTFPSEEGTTATIRRMKAVFHIFMWKGQ